MDKMMKRSTSPKVGEGLKLMRVLMVLSSFSPLFILWAVQGSSLISNWWLLPVCGLAFLLPNAGLYLRIKLAIKKQHSYELTIGTSEDHTNDVLVYLLAMLLPLYSPELSSIQGVLADGLAFVLIVALFYKLRLHYINPVLIFLGYHIFAVRAPDDGNPLNSNGQFFLITRRLSLDGERLPCYVISDTWLLERR